METQHTYKSFNKDKPLEELLYNIANHGTRLKDLKLELLFYVTLIDRPIFKDLVLNLYETLARLKKDVVKLDKKRLNLLSKVDTQINLITNKIASQNKDHDQALIDGHDKIEQEIFIFHDEVSSFKFNFLQYILSVMNN